MIDLFAVLRFRSIPHIIPFRKPVLQRIKDLFIPPLFKKDCEWQINAIADFAKVNEMSFHESLCFLLSCELNERGYFRGDYEPDIHSQPEPESPRELPRNQCKILSFKYHNGFLTDLRLAAGNKTGKCKTVSFEYRNLEYPNCGRLDFIWDHLP